MQFKMKKNSNQWICSDRELLLRSKLEAGWSVKSTNFRTIATNCKEEIKEPNTINQITDSEQEMIMEVLRRSQRIDQMEQRRINKLLERLKIMKRNAKGDGQNSCALCNEIFSFFIFDSSKICNDCKKYVCAKCSVTNYSTNKKKIILCKVCNETRENNQIQSDTNDKEADSLHRRCSSEQAYYEIINSNNNHFELSPNKDKSNFLIPPLDPHTMSYDRNNSTQCLENGQNYAKNNQTLSEKDNQIVKLHQNLESNQSMEQISHQTLNKISSQKLNHTLNQNLDETIDHNLAQTIGQCLGQSFGQSLEKNIEQSVQHTQQQSDLFRSKEEEKLKELERDEKNSLIDNRCLFIVPSSLRQKNQQNFKSIETRRESNSSTCSLVKFGSSQNNDSNFNHQNLAIRKLNNETVSQKNHRLNDQLSNQINNNSNYRFDHSVNHHANHLNIDQQAKEPINDQIYKKIDQMKKMNPNQSTSDGFQAAINHEDFSFQRSNNMMNCQNQNMVYNQAINHNRSNYQASQQTQSYNNQNLVYNANYNRSNQVQSYQSSQNDSLRSNARNGQRTSLISDFVGDINQTGKLNENQSTNLFSNKSNDSSINHRFYPFVNQTSHQYEHHSSIIHSIKSSTTNQIANLSASNLSTLSNANMQSTCSSFNNSHDLSTQMNQLLYPPNYVNVNQNMYQDRRNSQNNNHLDVFYYSQPTTPSSPMQTLNQHPSNLQQQTIVNSQSNINYPNNTNLNYIAQTMPMNQVNPFNQNFQSNQINQLVPMTQPSRNQTKTNNLIKSLCSPVRNNHFVNRIQQARSSNSIKSSPNFTNNQILNPIDQTNLISSMNYLSVDPNNFLANKSSTDYRYIN